MPVVSDTSPLLNLAIIGQLHLLRQQFGEILIPPAVEAELRLGSTRPGSRVLTEAVADGWIHTVELANTALAATLRHDLDAGEAEAIALCAQLGAKVVLIDESDGRAAARRLDLQPVGVVGILLTAKRDGSLASIAEALTALVQQAHFRLGDRLVAAALEEAGEMPNDGAPTP
jgi:hypothetical protein